jgi:hypothetical protein
MADKIAAGTAEGMLDFLDFIIDRGLATAAAVNPWKSAAKRILSTVEGSESYGAVDIRTLDPDEYFGRFSNIAMGELTPESLTAYRQRFRKAVDAYRGYLADPANWKPARSASSRPNSNGNGGGSPRRRERAPKPLPSSSGDLIDFPFPLESGELAHFHLPKRVSKADAERMSTFLRTLPLEPQKQIPARTAEEKAA